MKRETGCLKMSKFEKKSTSIYISMTLKEKIVFLQDYYQIKSVSQILEFLVNEKYDFLMSLEIKNKQARAQGA